MWNHISARLGKDGSFLVTPGDRHFDEVTPESFVVSSPSNANVTADVIHTSIYKARPDVGAIVHHHSTSVVAVSALAKGLQCVTQDSAAFYDSVAYHDWEGLSDDYDECERLAAAVRDPKVTTLILRNHGAVTLGATVSEAWVRYYYLDRVCKVQCSIGSQPVNPPDPAALEHAAKQYAPPDGPFRHGVYEWPALLRLAKRLREGTQRHTRS